MQISPSKNLEEEKKADPDSTTMTTKINVSNSSEMTKSNQNQQRPPVHDHSSDKHAAMIPMFMIESTNKQKQEELFRYEILTDNPFLKLKVEKHHWTDFASDLNKLDDDVDDQKKKEATPLDLMSQLL